MDCCHAAHKAGFLLPYLAQSNSPDWRDVEMWADVINALFEHPKFRFDWANQVKEGIIASTRVLFPKWWKK